MSINTVSKRNADENPFKSQRMTDKHHDLNEAMHETNKVIRKDAFKVDRDRPGA